MPGADLGGLEQVRHNQQAAAALARSVNVDWDGVTRAQSEFLRGILGRLGQPNDRYLEVVRSVMTAASAAKR